MGQQSVQNTKVNVYIIKCLTSRSNLVILRHRQTKNKQEQNERLLVLAHFNGVDDAKHTHSRHDRFICFFNHSSQHLDTETVPDRRSDRHSHTQTQNKRHTKTPLNLPLARLASRSPLCATLLEVAQGQATPFVQLQSLQVAYPPLLQVSLTERTLI